MRVAQTADIQLVKATGIVPYFADYRRSLILIRPSFRKGRGNMDIASFPEFECHPN